MGKCGVYNGDESWSEREKFELEEEDKIKKALMKKALGYCADEVVEEYACDEGEMKLSKKKVTKKHYSPDISAVKVLLERYYKTYEDKVLAMSDEELLKEQEKLKKMLKDIYRRAASSAG